jgi:hypothetical protein
LQLPDNEKKLNAPPVFNLFGYPDTLICSWNGAKKACLICKNAGHSSSKCPTKKPKNQKVGELANPLQKIGGVGQDQKRKDKGPEKVPGSSGKITGSSTSSASATTSATVATPATVSQPIFAPTGSFTVTSPIGSSTPTAPASVSATASFLGSELQQRQVTPPPLIQYDPDMPTKGNKRMSKDDDLWSPTIAEVKQYCSENNICGKCCKVGHQTDKCSQRGRVAWISLSSSIDFLPHMKKWSYSRRKRGGSWQFLDISTFKPYIPPVLKCNHCGQDHLGIDCPEKPTYAYEAMDVHQ